MPSIFDLGDGVEYEVVDAKIAANEGDGTFGTLVDIPSIDRLTVRVNVKSAQARGDGRITYVASQIESANVTFRNFSIKQDILEILTGATSYDTGSTPNQKKRIKIGANRMRWFGICGKALVGDSADTHLFIPYMRVMEAFEFNIAYNEFVQPEIQAMALGDPVLLDDNGDPLLVDIVRHETAVVIAMPPA